MLQRWLRVRVRVRVHLRVLIYFLERREKNETPHMPSAIRFVAIDPVELAGGGLSYAYRLELSSSGTQPLHLSERYSAFRVVAVAAQNEFPEKAVTLPAFPQKQLLAPQTPSFLKKRGGALARYMEALLSETTLASMPEVQKLLARAAPPTANGAPRAVPAEITSPVEATPVSRTVAAAVAAPPDVGAKETPTTSAGLPPAPALGAQMVGVLIVSVITGLLSGELLFIGEATCEKSATFAHVRCQWCHCRRELRPFLSAVGCCVTGLLMGRRRSQVDLRQ